MKYNLNIQEIDTWNKENPDEQYTYQQCEEVLDEQIEFALEGLQETLGEKIDWWSSQYNWESDNALPDSSFFDYKGEFNALVVDKYHGKD